MARLRLLHLWCTITHLNSHPFPYSKLFYSVNFPPLLSSSKPHLTPLIANFYGFLKMWGFDDCRSRCKTNDAVVYDYVTKKISCFDCGLEFVLLTSDLETSRNPSSHPVSVANTEPNNASSSSSSDGDILKNLGFDPLAVATTQQSNAPSDDATIIASMSARYRFVFFLLKKIKLCRVNYRLIHLFYRLKLLATVKVCVFLTVSIQKGA